ncbi:30S ribosomal protein S11 [Candidatus Kaiserbacteria bacterium CG10_big_fil_rev_8_21_14_0_10_59_10]|uniref:Small ribosomal subunit protein uS11 n=1 Tax=Candidatus Kaiserbacteria bacterium CG10_big_fil_rev_8_21_14_0_10_59_10 TaxID=1974612 RepID=A0A2H0U743_9BACT|nr:MAG: 30S ribosomal protein S11 [Candidatus Kaiserbacteria bacterium CG10_big_fil_rev_8_21_14_0_10_59_10]
MGKKRIIRKSGGTVDQGLKSRSLARLAKRSIGEGTLHIQATFNNTKVLLTDKQGNAITSSSSGALGFAGAKKGTPFAAAKVGELVGEKAAMIGVKEVDVVIRGVGAGRESAIRAFAGKGIDISRIADDTPVPHNGPRPPKPRRV